MNTLIEDLAHAAGTVMQAALNELPERVKLQVANACEAGGEIELRFREGSPVTVQVWLFNQAGQGVELTRFAEPAN